MEKGKSLQLLLPMPLIPRLDRLDDMLNYIEAKKGLPGKGSDKDSDPVCNLQSQLERQRCKPLNLVLEEVACKESLMERIAVLESRVSKLYFEIEKGESQDAKIEENRVESIQVKKRKNKGRVHWVSRYRRLLRWIHMNC